MEDAKLLREFVDKGSENAFTTLVNRHLSLVYSAALRRLSDVHVAEEVTQTTFCLLAQKAHTLRSESALAGWLHQTVCHLTAKHWRTEYRRRQREQEAMYMSTPPSSADATWDELAPFLDEAMSQLPAEDRSALLLRFFQGKAFIQVGLTLGISEDAARMRVNRALEKLRQLLARQKITCTTAPLGAMLLEYSVSAVPAPVTASVQAAAKTAQTVVSASLLKTVLSGLTSGSLKTATIACLVATCLLLGLNSAMRKESNGSVLNADSKATTNAQQKGEVASKTTPRLRLAAKQKADGASAKAEYTMTEPQALYEQAMVHQREKRLVEAEDAYTKSVALLDSGVGRWPAFTDVYFTRATFYGGAGNYAAAVTNYTRMLDFEPKRFEALFNRASGYHALKKTELALVDYTTILTDQDVDFSHNVDPKDELLAMTYQNRGEIYGNLKDYEKALSDYSAAITLMPDGGEDMIMYWRRASTYRSAGRLDRATEDANFMAARALETVTNADATHGQIQNAMDITSFVCRILPQPLPYHLEAHAAAQAKNRQFDNAVKTQQRAITAAAETKTADLQVMQARLELYLSGKALPAEGSVR